MCARVGYMCSDNLGGRPTVSDSARDSEPGGIRGCATLKLPADSRVTCRPARPFSVYSLDSPPGAEGGARVGQM